MGEIEYENEAISNRIVDNKLLDITWDRFMKSGAVLDYLLYSSIKNGRLLDKALENEFAPQAESERERKDNIPKIEKGIENNDANDNSRSRAESDRLLR